MDYVDNMDTEDFLKACEYLDMKDHVMDASDMDRKQAENTKPPKR